MPISSTRRGDAPTSVVRWESQTETYTVTDQHGVRESHTGVGLSLDSILSYLTHPRHPTHGRAIAGRMVVGDLLVWHGFRAVAMVSFCGDGQPRPYILYDMMGPGPGREVLDQWVPPGEREDDDEDDA